MGAKVGLFGIGLEAYWPQFPGLKSRLEGYQERIARKLTALGAEVTDIGLIDDPDKARKVALSFREAKVDILFLYVSTYALSHTVLPIALQTGLPVLILNLQPEKSIDYEKFNALADRGLMTGEWLANCQACCVPELANVFNNAGVTYDIVTGWLDDESAWNKIGQWIAAASAKATLRDTRIGILGHYYGGMLDVYTDLTRMTTAFGCHFDILEMDYLRHLRDRVSDPEVEAKLRQFDAEFDISPECVFSELQRAAISSCALDKLVEERKLGALAYYYEGFGGNEHENIIASVIAGNTLLTAHHVPVAGECEVKNVVAMKIMDELGAGGSFSEFYLMDFEDDAILLGHDGPAHPGIAEGRVGLVPLSIYHGKPGKGLSIQMQVRHGPATLLSIVQGPGGKTFLLVAEGESVPGPTLKIGNTNSRYRFPIPARDFADAWSKAGPAHHCAIGSGHVAGSIEKLALLLGMECRRIC